MFALIAHITMEEEPLIAAIAGVGVVAGALGTLLGLRIGGRRNRAEERTES